MFVVVFLSIFSLFSLGVAYENGQEYSVKCNLLKQCSLVPGRIYSSETHAYGTYQDDVLTEGWGKLWVHGDDSINGWYQAGFLEGALTSERIFQHFISWFDYQFPSTAPLTNETTTYILEQYDYALQLSTSNAHDEYYTTLAKLLSQFQGILDGQNSAATDKTKRLSLLDLLLLEAAGDLYDIIPAVNPAQFKLKVGKIAAEEFFDNWHNQISCSALIKIPDDKSDVLAGHTSWTSYQNMLRIYKNYDLDGGRYQSSHSSKPGVIYSKDDFYALSRTHLVVMETTNGVLNSDLYQYVTVQSLLTWQRLPVVNALAESGEQWTALVSKHNSGTYANQWMVVDMKLFKAGQGVTQSSGFLWIIELAPGIAVRNDVTAVMLAQGNYWPSYNIPYDKTVYEKSGFQQAYETYGDQYSYTNCPRALIFARDEGKVQSFDSLRSLLRYNNYQQDPLSQNNPANAISSRYELRTENPRTYGGVDTKATSFTRLYDQGKTMALASAQSGPTHDNLAPFQWSTSGFNEQVHVGQPDVFNFDFAEMDYKQH